MLFPSFWQDFTSCGSFVAQVQCTCTLSVWLSQVLLDEAIVRKVPRLYGVEVHDLKRPLNLPCFGTQLTKLGTQPVSDSALCFLLTCVDTLDNTFIELGLLKEYGRVCNIICHGNYHMTPWICCMYFVTLHFFNLCLRSIG